MKVTTFIIIIFIFLGFYAFLIEPNMLFVRNYTLNDKSLQGIRIVFVSDFHVRPKQEKRLQSIVEKINLQNPDIVLMGGDFVNDHDMKKTMPIENIVKELQKLDAYYGIYTVLGNHDWWQNGTEISKDLKLAGINVLENSNKKIEINGKTLYIAGVEDLTTRHPDVSKALKGAGSPAILLTHSPDVFPQVPQFVNLTLTGHCHGGQVVFPKIGALIVPSDYGNRYIKGLVDEIGKRMIATTGLGTSIIHARFLCPPEIVVIDFI